MSESPTIGAPGLRERKKAKTRAAIQDQAMRLFREQGYDGTTVEQIAEAAEVSPSTFFRYFGTKEDVVAYDALDPLVMAAWRSQPADVKPIEAMRKAMWDVFASMDQGDVDEMMDRGRLLFGQPELRQAAIGELVRTGRMVADELAARLGRPTDDFEVRVFAGATLGAIMAVLEPMIEDASLMKGSGADLLKMVDRALSFLDEGLPL
jgi:AcrR family transcriptional regulator